MAEAPQLKEVHTPWDCRWIRIGQRIVSLPDKDQPEGLWQCMRPPAAPRAVTEEDCVACAFWEPSRD